MPQTGFETFSIYGFSFEYPIDCRVEFNPKSRRDGGDVVFHYPDRTKIYASWGDLEKAVKRFQTVEAHAEHSLNALKKSGAVKNFQKLSEEALKIRSHKGILNHVKMEEMSVGLFSSRRGVPREASSVHVHCEDSSRYFVIYGLFSGEKVHEYEKALMTMANSLKCH